VTEAEGGPPVDHRELANDRTGSEYRTDALPACRRGNARLEQAFVDPIATVALLPRHEQGLGSRERDSPRLGEQTLRQLRGQRANKLSGLGKLAGKLPSLHDTPPAPPKHLTRCLRNRVQAKVVGEVLQYRQQRFRFARHLYFPNDLACAIHNADARLLDRNVQSSKL